MSFTCLFHQLRHYTDDIFSPAVSGTALTTMDTTHE